MGESKAISIRIPDELLDKVNKLAEEKHKSTGKPNKSQVIQNALIAYFDTLSDNVSNEVKVTEYDTVSIADFKELQDFVATLSESVKRLEESLLTKSDTVIKTENVGSDQKVSKALDHTQLSVLKVEEDLKVKEGLTTAKLAERFGIKPNDVTSKKFKSKNNPNLFVSWSKEKDPDGQAWEFRKDSKLFYQVQPASLSEGEAEAQTNHPQGLAF